MTIAGYGSLIFLISISVSSALFTLIFLKGLELVLGRRFAGLPGPQIKMDGKVAWLTGVLMVFLGAVCAGGLIGLLIAMAFWQLTAAAINYYLFAMIFGICFSLALMSPVLLFIGLSIIQESPPKPLPVIQHSPARRPARMLGGSLIIGSILSWPAWIIAISMMV